MYLYENYLINKREFECRIQHTVKPILKGY